MYPTVVTSLYNINRHNLDGREWSSYLQWFAKTLQVNNPMVVFVEKELEDFVYNIRGSLPTKVIVSKLEDTFYYGFKSQMDEIIFSESYKNKIKSSDRIECNSSLYNIIQYSKFYWVEKAAEENPFNTDTFLWLDAGISRFFEQIDLSKGFRYNEKIGDRIFLQIFMSSYPDLANADVLEETYLFDDRSYVAGGIFLTSKDFIKNIKSAIDDIFLNKMLAKSNINNEQICLGYLIKKYPEKFNLFKHYYGQHRNYEILNFLNV